MEPKWEVLALVLGPLLLLCHFTVQAVKHGGPQHGPLHGIHVNFIPNPVTCQLGDLEQLTSHISEPSSLPAKQDTMPPASWGLLC